MCNQKVESTIASGANLLAMYLIKRKCFKWSVCYFQSSHHISGHETLKESDTHVLFCPRLVLYCLFVCFLTLEYTFRIIHCHNLKCDLKHCLDNQ